jgi:hypothetical protein
MRAHAIAFSIAAALLVGCGKDGENLADKAGESVGRHVTGFSKGVGRGIDQKMTVEVTLRPEVQALGLTNTVAKAIALDSAKKGITVYLISSQSVSNTLVARALNADGLEIGRARKDVVLKNDDAAYVTFEFEGEMDAQLVKRYTIGL